MSGFDKWKDLENKVLTENRFFCKPDILKDIEKLSNEHIHILPKNSLVYRARITTEAELEKDSPKFTDEEWIDALRDNYQLLEAEERLLQEKGIMGLNEEHSGAPPIDYTQNGRANPKYISYLYVAMKPYTALVECKPSKLDKISVATFKTKRDLKLFDTTLKGKNCTGKDLIFPFRLFFTLPVKNSEKDYIITQYLSEYMKHLGFDGIQFLSGLHESKENGINITLFDTNCCKFVRSESYSINDVVYLVKDRKAVNKNIIPEDIKDKVNRW